MRDAAEAVVEFVQGRDRIDLDSDRMLLFVVVRAIEVIGEAASAFQWYGTRALALSLSMGSPG
ncbi:MAG TPA: hypothetical protein PKZ19_15000 [Zoogloea sp.]|nr:hypothetical protein [Zoogloea sp.]